MSELSKKLHILKNGATEEETVTLYSTEEECTEPNLKLKIDGAMAYAKLGDVTDAEASALRVYRNSDGVTYAVLKTAVTNYWVDTEGEVHTVDASEVETVSKTAFMNNESVYKVVFPSCKEVDHGSLTTGAFHGCKNLVDVSLPNVERIGAGAFKECTSLVNVDIPNAIELYGWVFKDCEKLTNVSAASVKSTYASVFSNCSALRAIYLPNCTYMLTCFVNCPALTEIHFAAANRTAIEALDGYASKFGATNATIYFDL